MRKEIEKAQIDYYNRTHSYWEFRAQKYFEEPKQKVLNKVVSILRNDAITKVLDIGSGPAHYAIKLSKNLGCQITCLDFSKEMLAKAYANVIKEGLIERFEFIRANIVYVDLPSDLFDAVTIISMLHYLIPADIEVALKKSYNTLKKGGKIIVVEYWANEELSDIEKFTLQIADQNRAKQGIETNFLKESVYKQLLQNAGFKDLRVSYVRERIYLDKYFEMNPEFKFQSNNNYSIRVAIFEAIK